MSNSNAVKLTFAGDSTSLDQAAKNVQNNLQATSREIAHAAEKTEAFGENVEGAAKHFRGGADAIDGLSGAAGAFGLVIPGPIGGMLQFTRGMADLADGAATTVIPALKGLKVATLAAIGPWGLAAIAVGLLVAGFVIAYKHSERFRSIVNAVGSELKGFAKDVGKVVGFFVDHWKLALLALGPFGLALDGIISNFGTIKKIVGGVAAVVKSAFEGAFGSIRAAYDASHIGDILSVVGKATSIGGSIVHSIPGFASGGRTQGGLAIVGENGPELVNFGGPAQIYSNSQSAAMVAGSGSGAGSGGGAQTVRVVISAGGGGSDVLDMWLRKSIRLHGAKSYGLAAA